ncbi:hypothetical protein [Actinocorallia sp. A-T 12471]|uniref:hypothetical protein n=1 Tax=Actinocorallia sp. A-T 12471 TaxID=3089813 RepID=UPI0029D38FBB|nr:hypothetical protein [Actinocorallia sp. A-T 12471]MDX6743536.1 hypothetical protein [Actinocorallia sp. A-T 12471]
MPADEEDRVPNDRPAPFEHGTVDRGKIRHANRGRKIFPQESGRSFANSGHYRIPFNGRHYPQVPARELYLGYDYEHITRRLKNSYAVRGEVAQLADRNATYTYDQVGNVKSISDVSAAGTDTQCMVYDYQRRVTSVWTEGDTTCSATPANPTGPAPYRSTYTYADDGQLQENYGYDFAGNTIISRSQRVLTGFFGRVGRALLLVAAAGREWGAAAGVT